MYFYLFRFLVALVFIALHGLFLVVAQRADSLVEVLVLLLLEASLVEHRL